MSFDSNLDPARWKAERQAMLESINHWKETANHEMKQHAKYMKLFFEVKEKYDKLVEANNIRTPNQS
jgi:hypothetical protein